MIYLVIPCKLLITENLIYAYRFYLGAGIHITFDANSKTQIVCLPLFHFGSDEGSHESLNIPSFTYRQVSNIRRTKSQHLNDSRGVLRLSLPNSLKPDVKSITQM